jgi:ketosteroid isomerase-like protein
MSATPGVITRYLHAADEQDFATLAECFTEDGVALDEGETYVGRDAIRGWRESVISKYTYTTTVTGTEAVGDDRFNVDVHLVGDFPGGEASLTEAFTLRDGLIAHLAIA